MNVCLPQHAFCRQIETYRQSGRARRFLDGLPVSATAASAVGQQQPAAADAAFGSNNSPTGPQPFLLQGPLPGRYVRDHAVLAGVGSCIM